MKPEDVELSLIVLTYNGGENVPSLLTSIHRTLSTVPGSLYELIVVDGDSPDGTADLAASLSQGYPIKVTRCKGEGDLATAVAEGFRQARGRVLGVINADLSYPIELIPDLLQAISGGADVAIASRQAKGRGIRGLSLGGITSKVDKVLAYLFLPITRGIRDPLSEFFLLKRDVIDGVRLVPVGCGVLLQVLVRGRIGKVMDVPYIWDERINGSRKLDLREQLSYFMHLCQLSGAKKGVKRFAKFCIVGAGGVFVNMGLLWLLTSVGGLYYLLSAIFAIEAAILFNFALNETWTFRDRRVGRIRALIQRALKFHLVSAAGVGINMATLYLLTDIAGVYYLASNLLGIALATLWNFSVNYLWTWRLKQ